MKKIKLTDEQIHNASYILKNFRNYSTFSDSKKSSYNFTNTVGVKICPYCNINYISTVFDEDKKEILRPDIDHYFCKSIYQKYELCLYNLIPSCLLCNERLKSDADFMKEPHIHPYFHDFDKIMYFSINLRSLDYMQEESFDIEFRTKVGAPAPLVKRAENTINTFKLRERYRYHKYEVILIFKKTKYYWKSKRQEIEKFFTSNENGFNDNFSFIPITALLFPERNCNINQTSLGKLKRDVIERFALKNASIRKYEFI